MATPGARERDGRDMRDGRELRDGREARDARYGAAPPHRDGGGPTTSGGPNARSPGPPRLPVGIAASPREEASSTLGSNFIFLYLDTYNTYGLNMDTARRSEDKPIP